MSRVIWQFGGVSFYRHASDEFAPRFDGKVQYTKDLVLGATTAAQNYVDIGGFDVAPLTLRCELATEALRQTLQGLQGTTGTLSNSFGLSYAVLLVEVKRINNSKGQHLADATWEAR